MCFVSESPTSPLQFSLGRSGRFRDGPQISENRTTSYSSSLLASSSLASRSCSLRCCLFQEREACRSASWRHRVLSRDGAGRGASARLIGGREFGSGCGSYLEAPPPITEPWSVLGPARLGRATSPHFLVPKENRQQEISKTGFFSKCSNSFSERVLQDRVLEILFPTFEKNRENRSFPRLFPKAAPRSPMFRGVSSLNLCRTASAQQVLSKLSSPRPRPGRTWRRAPLPSPRLRGAAKDLCLRDREGEEST